MADFTSKRGLRWHYELKGSGETVLFIHGFGGSSHWWHYQTDFLAHDHQTVAIDLPGHGQSQWLPLSLNEMAQDVVQLVNSFGEDRKSVV